jgi:hypothetical protein
VDFDETGDCGVAVALLVQMAFQPLDELHGALGEALRLGRRLLDPQSQISACGIAAPGSSEDSRLERGGPD